MELQVQSNSPSATPCPFFPFPPPLPPSPSPSPSSVLSWVGGASQHWRGGRWRGRVVEREGRDCKGNKLESLAVKFLEARHYTHWLITMFTYHTSLSSLKLCTAYNTVPFLATASRKVWMLTWGPGTRELIGMLCWVIYFQVERRPSITFTRNFKPDKWLFVGMILQTIVAFNKQMSRMVTNNLFHHLSVRWLCV